MKTETKKGLLKVSEYSVWRYGLWLDLEKYLREMRETVVFPHTEMSLEESCDGDPQMPDFLAGTFQWRLLHSDFVIGCCVIQKAHRIEIDFRLYK